MSPRKITLEEKWSRYSILLPILVFLIGISATPAFGIFSYSGPQNILLQGVPGANQTFAIKLAGDPGSWDILNLGIALDGAGGGTNNIFAGAEVALASSSGGFPLITRFKYGDPYPSSPVFGSGSEILWGFGTGPADGDFFAAVMFGTFGTGPAYPGWVHLRVSSSATSSPTITVIDWAYSDQTIAMGQGSTSTTLTSSANPSALGQPVTLTAIVISLAGTPTGTITFTDGTATLETVALSSGQSSSTRSSLTAGNHPMTAHYNGSVGFPPSADSLSQHVTGVGEAVFAANVVRMHIGLANSDDAGIRFDLRAEVYRNGADLLGLGELSSVTGGSSGYNNSHEFTMPLSLAVPPVASPGDIVSIRLLARNACTGSGKNSGRARLWYDDADADTGFDAIMAGQHLDFFVVDGAQLASTPGGGPKRTIDVVAGAKCSPYQSFGVWSRTLP